MLGILLLIAIVSAFFTALFWKDKRKLFVSLIFTCIVGVTLLILLTRLDAVSYVLCIIAMPIIIAVMLRCKGRAVASICWTLALLFSGLAVFWFMMSWKTGYSSAQEYLSRYFWDTWRDIREYWYDLRYEFVHYPEAVNIDYYQKFNEFYSKIVDFNSVNFWDIPSSTIIIYLLIHLSPILVFLAFMIAVSIMRVKRMKNLLVENKTDSNSAKTKDGYYRRVQRNGCVTAGNILSGVSYLLMLLGIRFIYFDRMDISSFPSTSFCITFIVIALICGFIAWPLLRYAIEYGYEMGAITKAIYIWSWIPAIIIIALIVVSVLIMCAFTDAEFSSVANKKVYKVIDENGEVRTLDYNGKDLYSKCKDDKGEWWETADGGSTFRKCDLYKIKDDVGHDKYTRDVSGGGKRIFTDGQGGTYESDDGGMTVTEQKD